jgi:hypothetical protein
VSLRRLLTLACCAALSLGVAACGKTNEPDSVENDGVYVNAGPLTYQLQVSRELNSFSTEDSQYLTGLPTGTSKISPDQLWYGVFLWAKNQTHQPAPTATRFVIVDTEGNRYYPLALNPAANQYAWRARTLQPSAAEPGPDTTASFGPTQGGLLLFRLNSSVYSNRPLTLQIYAPGESKPAAISLDL